MTAAANPDRPATGVCVSEAQREEAAEWFVVIHAEDGPGNDTLQAWLRWMDQDEGNREAFESVVQTWHGTPESAAVRRPSALELSTDTYDGEQSVDQWLAERQATEHQGRAQRHSLARARRLRRWTWLAAASFAAAIVGTVALNRHATSDRARNTTFATHAGEKIEVMLEDGSRVWLGPSSAMQVSFDAQRRSIQLSSGEAYFAVKKDPGRPFVVGSVSGSITAVGTAFNVRALADHVTVSVTEGVVTVAPSGELAIQPSAVVTVAAGQVLTFKAHESVQDLTVSTSTAAGERARWREGILVYSDEPLRDVVTDVARYSGSVHLALTGDVVGNMPYTGIVYANAIDEWAAALSVSFPVKVISDGDRRIITAR